MNDLSQIDHDQFRQLVKQGKTPEEAAEILLQSRRTVADALQRLLEEPPDVLQKMLQELDAQEAPNTSQENR
jgi:hypothetical protein